MATTVTIKEQNGEGVVSNKQVQIESMLVLQYKQLMGAINELIKEVQEDPNLKGLFAELFGENPEASQEEILDNMDIMEMFKQIIGSFEILLERMPSHAVKIISILSGVDEQTLDKQNLFTLLDIYDAIIEENDINRLVERLKKSQALTVAKVNFKNFLTSLNRNKQQ